LPRKPTAVNIAIISATAALVAASDALPPAKLFATDPPVGVPHPVDCAGGEVIPFTPIGPAKKL
jgi:hypothetical protein